MDNPTIELISSISNAAAAIAALGIAWHLGKRTETMTAAQHRLEATSISVEWFRDLRSWASEAVDVLSKAIYACPIGSDEGEGAVLKQCRYHLSALIDRGRFLLPNVRPESYGREKQPAFRGFRHAALDPLVASEIILGGTIGTHPDARSALVTMKKEFVSRIQKILAPEVHNSQIAEIIRMSHTSRSDDETLGGLLPHPTIVPGGVEPLLNRH